MLKDSDGELPEEQLATCLVPLNLKTESVAKQQMCSYHYTRHVDQPFNTGFSLIAQGRVVRPFRGSNHAESVSCHLESLKLVNALWATTPVNPATRMSSNLFGQARKTCSTIKSTSYCIYKGSATISSCKKSVLCCKISRTCASPNRQDIVLESPQ